MAGWAWRSWVVVVCLVGLCACYRTHDRPWATDSGAGGGGPAGTGGGPATGGAPGPQEEPPEDAPASCVEMRYAPQPAAAAVDIVWAVDSSRSMMNERAQITETINDFVRSVQARVSDVRVVMVTDVNIVPAPLGTDPDRYLFVERYVDSNEPLQALLEQLPAYRDFLRPNADPHVIVVSDDDSDLAADAFLAELGAAIGSFTFHAVASPDIDGEACRDTVPSGECLMLGDQYPALCGGAAPGIEYYALAAATGGQQISICDTDWAGVFDLLSDAVLDPIPIPCVIALDVRADGRPYGTVAVSTLPEMAPPPRELPSVDDCAPGVPGFHHADVGPPLLVLCPALCEALTASGAELLLRLDCDGG